MSTQPQPQLDEVSCPVCSKAVVADMINQHLDRCVGAPEKKVDVKPQAKRVRESAGESSQIKRKPSDSARHPFFKPRKASESAKDLVIDIEDSPTHEWNSSPEVVEGPSSPEPATTSKSPMTPSLPHTSKLSSSKPTKSPKPEFKPLADLLRPNTLEDYVGQEDAVGEKTLLRRLIASNNIPSVILWGPPGCGKTTLAHIISKRSRDHGHRFVSLSAVSSGIKDVKDAVSKATTDQKLFRVKTILFLDEIHRFNKLQQDVFLPFVENGTITLIGATTENPSFTLNSALLSRCKVIVLEKLSSENILQILRRGLSVLKVRVVKTEGGKGDDDKGDDDKGDDEIFSDDEQGVIENDKGSMGHLKLTSEAVDFLVAICDGDCRTALNSLQAAVDGYKEIKGYTITKEDIKTSLKKTHFLYDRKGDNHYDTISAYIKSMRAGKDTAALYYLARMLSGGEDPRFIARRLVVFASEDIGLANPSMLTLGVSTYTGCEKIGMPECRIMLSHCTVEFCRARKSRESYDAYANAEKLIASFQGPHPPVPLTLRNAPTKLMKELGYGKGDKGTHMPDGMQDVNFFKR